MIIYDFNFSASLELRYFEVVTSYHHSVSEVKPWDFYFRTTKFPKFSEFLEETLLPAYCVAGVGTSDEDMQRKIRFAAEKWYESCEVDDGRGREKKEEKEFEKSFSFTSF